MSTVFRARDLRALLAAGLMSASVASCDFFDSKKVPLAGERIPVFADRDRKSVV